MPRISAHGNRNISFDSLVSIRSIKILSFTLLKNKILKVFYLVGIPNILMYNAFSHCKIKMPFKASNLATSREIRNRFLHYESKEIIKILYLNPSTGTLLITRKFLATPF